MWFISLTVPFHLQQRREWLSLGLNFIRKMRSWPLNDFSSGFQLRPLSCVTCWGSNSSWQILEEAYDYKSRPFITKPSCLSCKCSKQQHLKDATCLQWSFVPLLALILETRKGWPLAPSLFLTLFMCHTISSQWNGKFNFKRKRYPQICPMLSDGLHCKWNVHIVILMMWKKHWGSRTDFGIDELRQTRQPFRTLLITLQYVKDIFKKGSEENY